MKRIRLRIAYPPAVVVTVSAALTKEQALAAFPKTRADCEDSARPCQFSTCRYHLSTDTISDRHGNETVIQTVAWSESKPSCALDVADDGPKSLDYVAELMGVSRVRVLRIEQAALKKARR